MNPVEGEDRVERAERAQKLARLSSACRQTGALMEAGVDILSITRILRAQSEGEDILRLCDRIDFDLKQGRALAEALSGEPELFSPFMVTLIRQGEERATLPQAFARVSSALDTERQELLQLLAAPASRPSQAAPAAQDGASGQSERPQVLAQVLAGAHNALGADTEASAEARARPESEASEAQAARAQARWLRAASSIGAGLLAASAVSEALGALGLAAKWQRPLSKALSAGVLALAALAARNIEAERSTAGRQVLAARDQPPTAPASKDVKDVEAGEDFHAAGAEAQAEEPQAEAPAPRQGSVPKAAATPEAEAPGSNAVYRGAPREDEEEPPRQMRRPRQEEEFD